MPPKLVPLPFLNLFHLNSLLYDEIRHDLPPFVLTLINHPDLEIMS